MHTSLTLQEKQEMIVQARLRVEPNANRAEVERWLDEPNALLHQSTPTEVIVKGGLDFLLTLIGTPYSHEVAKNCQISA